MQIKQPWLAGISAILLVVVIGYATERLIFILNSKKTTGTVSRIESYNGSCTTGTKRNRRTYPCTKYSAYIDFVPEGSGKHEFHVSAGDERGHDQSDRYASLHAGEQVPVVYDSRDPNNVFRDTLFDVWGGPIMVFFAQIASFLASLAEPRRNRYT